MDFNSILDFIKENSWVLGSGGVVGLIVLIKSIFGKCIAKDKSRKKFN